jgi:hypothetical protein
MTLEELRSSRPFVPSGVAAVLLGVSDTRIRQLILSGKLSTLNLCGARFVYVSSLFQAKRRKQLRTLRYQQARKVASKVVA